jgi:DNA transposition AAA+ family ATPase
MNDARAVAFVETVEHRRFVEFCDACRRHRYIGLCYGPPGVGKTLSARRHARWDAVMAFGRQGVGDGVPLNDALGDVAFYSVPVVNTAVGILQEVARLRERLRDLVRADIERQKEIRIAEVRKRELEVEQDELRRGVRRMLSYRTGEASIDRIEELHLEYGRRCREAADPTTLLLVDEADRLRMASLEQLRDVSDGGGIGLVLIGMPGLERRLSRYAQLYSRVGFVHAYRALSAEEVGRLIREGWTPPGAGLSAAGVVDEEALAAIVRITAGNFRLLDRLLSQVGRVLSLNGLETVTREVVETAREVLVIGAA